VQPERLRYRLELLPRTQSMREAFADSKSAFADEQEQIKGIVQP
jgi:hypothetical protein